VSIQDARDVAKTLGRNGWTIETSTDKHGRPHWIATHDDAPTPVTWGPNVNKRAIVRKAGDLIGDVVLARRNMGVNKAKQADKQLREDAERARFAQRRAVTTRRDPIAERQQQGPLDLDTRHVAAVRAIGYTIEPHALQRIRERDVDPGNLCRCLARPETKRVLSNGHVLYATPTCKVYVDPDAKRILTVV
jgi:hypothetical protein